MFSHPYGHIEQYSDESTRGNTKHGGDSSSAAFSARVKRDRIGSMMIMDQEEASFGAQASKVSAPKVAEQLSLTQSLFSAIGNLVSGGGSTTSKENL